MFILTVRQRQEDGFKFQASLDYIVPCQSRLKSECLSKKMGGRRRKEMWGNGGGNWG